MKIFIIAKILVNKEHDYPRLMKYRGDNKLKGDYYGPFASAGAVNKTIDTLQKAFLIRTCSNHVFENRSRPCLLYQINRCSAPCTGEITTPCYGVCPAVGPERPTNIQKNQAPP